MLTKSALVYDGAMGNGPCRARSFACALLMSLALCLFAPHAAHADPTPEAAAKAAQLKEQGNKAMDGLRYQQALALYAEAYGLTQDPALLYNKGRALEALGDFPEALAAQEEFDAKASPELKQKVAGLQKLLADLRSRVSVLELRVNVEDAEVRAGDRVLGPASQKRFVLNAGKLTVKVQREGYFPIERDLALAGGQTTVLDLTLLSKAERGVLVVRSPVSGAMVTVDGVAFGMVPTDTPVMPGTHRVHLSHEGYKPADSTAVVAAGETRQLDLSLEAETPVYKKWWFWTGIGLVVAGGVTAAVAYTTEKSPTKGTIDPGQVSTAVFRF
jgi:hypothetical protein